LLLFAKIIHLLLNSVAYFASSGFHTARNLSPGILRL
jgi:hypothetical protein